MQLTAFFVTSESPTLPRLKNLEHTRENPQALSTKTRGAARLNFPWPQCLQSTASHYASISLSFVARRAPSHTRLKCSTRAWTCTGYRHALSLFHSRRGELIILSLRRPLDWPALSSFEAKGLSFLFGAARFLLCSGYEVACKACGFVGFLR